MALIFIIWVYHAAIQFRLFRIALLSFFIRMYALKECDVLMTYFFLNLPIFDAF